MASNSYSKIKKIFSFLNNLTKATIIVFVALSLIFICLQVFCRFILNSALPWPEEAVVFLMVWYTFLAAVYVQQERAHIRFVFFYEKLSPKIRLLLNIISSICVVLFMAIVSVKGIQVCTSLYKFQYGALKVSKAIPFFAVPFGALLMIFVTMGQIAEDFKELRKK